MTFSVKKKNLNCSRCEDKMLQSVGLRWGPSSGAGSGRGEAWWWGLAPSPLLSRSWGDGEDLAAALQKLLTWVTAPRADHGRGPCPLARPPERTHDIALADSARVQKWPLAGQ